MVVLPVLILFWSFFSLFKAAEMTETEVLDFHYTLNRWNARFARDSNVTSDLIFYELIVAKLKDKVPQLKHHPDTLKRFYEVSFKSFEQFSVLYEFAGDKTRPLKLLSELYGFAEILFDEQVFNEYQLFEYFIKAVNRIMKDGYYGDSYESLVSYVFTKPEKLIKCIYFFTYYYDNEDLEGVEPLMHFLFRYLNEAKNRNLLVAAMNNCPEIAFKSLKFIHKHKSIIGKYFVNWNEIFFKYIRDTFSNHMNEDDVKLLLELAKEIKTEDQIDWVVKIFQTSLIANFCSSNEKLLPLAVDILVKIKSKFPEKFNNLMGGLGKKTLEKFSKHIKKHEERKVQIGIVVEARLLLPKLKRTDGPNPYDQWGAALLGLKALKLGGLPIADAKNLGERIYNTFLSLYEDFKASNDDQILIILNCYIEVCQKLGFTPIDSVLKFREVVILFTDRLAKEFHIRTDEIQFEELKSYLRDYHCDVFFDRSESALHLSKFFQFCKINKFNMRVFIEFTSRLGWFSPEVAINNLIYRVDVFAWMKVANEPGDEEELEQIIDYFYNELKILSKTQVLALSISVKDSVTAN